MPKVVVYVRTSSWQELKDDGLDPAEWARSVVASALEGRDRVVTRPRPSSGGTRPDAPSPRPRRSTKGAEPVVAGSSDGGEGAPQSPESAPAPAAGAKRVKRSKTERCPHGTPAGTYCKRCGE